MADIKSKVMTGGLLHASFDSKKTSGSNMDTQQCYIGKGRSLKGNHVRPARTESTLKHSYLLFTLISNVFLLTNMVYNYNRLVKAY